MGKFILAAEAEQGHTILRKWRRSAAHLRDGAGIVEHGVPHQLRPEHFHERRGFSDFAAAPRQPVYCAAEEFLKIGQVERTAGQAGRGQSVGEFPKGLRARAGSEMIDVVRWLLL